MEPDDITGVILVGGKSSRMGRDKAMLPLYGTILFDKVLDTLRAGLKRVILVGDHPERFAGKAFHNVNTMKEYEAILGRKKHGR